LKGVFLNHFSKIIGIIGAIIMVSRLCVAQAPKVLEPEVTFLREAPVIDGMLDKGLESLPVRRFTVLDPQNADSMVHMNYRMAYGAAFFYLYVEAEAEHLTYRDRAYQNGDGFVMLLARALPDGEPADEFYELACSAVKKPALEWTRRIFWNYNVDKLFVQTGEDAKLETHEGGGRIGFELLLPWSDVRPYHPWLPEGIGFNLTFTKAMEPEGKIYFAAVDDGAVGAEFKKRLYARLRFESPDVNGKPQTFVSLPYGHLTEGDSLRGIAVTASDKPFAENLIVRVNAGEGRTMASGLIGYDCQPGLTVKSFAVGTGRLPVDGYSVRWQTQNGSSRGSCGLSVLQKFDTVALHERLTRVREHQSKSTIATIEFLMGELSGKLRGLKPYETALSERLTAASFMKILNAAEAGADPFAGRSGFIRKAYRSRIDGTLQPYVVYLPENIDKDKKYPLLVFLHGSASHETDILGFQSRIPDGFIVLGPFGRGPSNGFSRDHAQDDIAEAISAVEEDYPIDAGRVILFGFSMGGYGVYRTFYETPSKFRALAVFSGGPSMGDTYARDSNPPDFSKEKNLRSFRGIPVFIFHGEKDMNVPIAATRDLVARLRNAGARVETRFEPDKGHESPSREGIEAFKKWVAGVVREEK
jgi:predicted esterase